MVWALRSGDGLHADLLRLLAIVVWFSLGWMAFWVLPLLWPAFKDGHQASHMA